MSEENNSETQTKEELESELLEIRKEIQWREREQEENANSGYNQGVAYLIISIFLIFAMIFGETIEIIIIWLVVSIVLLVYLHKSFNKSPEGKRIKKAKQELENLRKTKSEIEKKLNSWEEKKKSKGKI